MRAWMKTALVLAIMATASLPSPTEAAHRRASIAFGDSIAAGTGAALGVPTVAVVGASSCTILGWVPKRGGFDHVVLSAGINDSGACVLKIRATLVAAKFIWIMPAPINGAVEKVNAALRPGDKVVSYACTGGCSKTNFHPGSYAKVAADVRKQW